MIEFGAAQEDSRVFFVRDNGVGFDINAQKLFAPFQGVACIPLLTCLITYAGQNITAPPVALNSKAAARLGG